MKKFCLSLISGILCFATTAFGQEPIFRNGDRVCFAGSSIARKGGNFHYINLFYATRYPDRKITFLNGGIGGDISNDTIATTNYWKFPAEAGYYRL